MIIRFTPGLGKKSASNQNSKDSQKKNDRCFFVWSISVRKKTSQWSRRQTTQNNERSKRSSTIWDWMVLRRLSDSNFSGGAESCKKLLKWNDTMVGKYVLDEALIGDVSIYAILFWIRGLKLFLMFLYAKHQLFDWFTTPKVWKSDDDSLDPFGI